MRVAIYARYSSDNQREASIGDQIRLCTERATREGWTVRKTFSDKEVSGTVPMLLRPGGRDLLAAAARKEFDVLIIESLDRAFRNIPDQELTIRSLIFQGIRILGCHDGSDTSTKGNEVMRILRGAMNEDYLRQLGEKTHRGQVGVVANGYHAGGSVYGYRPVRDGERGSRLVQVPEEVEVVRWVFERYAEGWSTRKIADDLNRRKVPAPRGTIWGRGAIATNRGSGRVNGILCNEKYVGRTTWNKLKWVKDDATGKKHCIVRPEKEWHKGRIEHAPGEKQIISDALWDKVHARLGRPAIQGGGHGAGQRPTTLFAGIFRCGHCDGPMISMNKLSYGCCANKEGGKHRCEGVLVNRKHVEPIIIADIRAGLLDEARIAGLVREAEVVAQDRAKHGAKAQETLRKRAAALTQEIDRLTDAVAAAGFSKALAARLSKAEAELADVEAELPAAKAAATVVPDIGARLKRKLLDLDRALKQDLLQARTLLLEWLGHIRIERQGDKVIATYADPISLMVTSGARSHHQRQVQLR